MACEPSCQDDHSVLLCDIIDILVYKTKISIIIMKEFWKLLPYLSVKEWEIKKTNLFIIYFTYKWIIL